MSKADDKRRAMRIGLVLETGVLRCPVNLTRLTTAGVRSWVVTAKEA